MAPAGWYPDPDRSDEESPRERRWDGEGWTDEVRPAAVAPDVPAQSPEGAAGGGPAPAPFPGPAPRDAPPGGHVEPPGPVGPYGRKRWTGRRPLALGI
ncbi:DUF2510 domain-containing protein, partial [Streptomyces phytophilus]|uniref:DUF2510 domain-containing protein n=1 Tax=Streptomyces phytophilus TaxID=722715 RepID=UPI0035A93022